MTDKILPLAAYRVEELIQGLSENTLLSLVMRLTGGVANPAVVQANIEGMKNE